MNPTRRRRAPVWIAFAVWVGLACAPLIRHAPAPEGWQQRLSAQDDEAIHGSGFPLPPPELERLMREPALEVRRAEAAGGGVTGALHIEADLPSAGRTLSFKWKRAPEGGDGWNNTPRREIAAYEIQKWFLAPDDYVVPTTVARCIPLAFAARLVPHPEPNLDGARCVFGTLTIWLDDVKQPDVQLDEALFYRDVRYARCIASYNLLTYLIRNKDTRIGNILVSKDPDAPRVYSVDNGISFGTGIYNFFQRHWNVIRVPALPRDEIDRLREVDEDDLEALHVVAELRRDDEGIYRATSASVPFDVENGVRLREGTLQLGLDPKEIDGVRERLADLIAAVDRGEIAVF